MDHGLHDHQFTHGIDQAVKFFHIHLDFRLDFDLALWGRSSF